MTRTDSSFPYLQGYPADLIARVEPLIRSGTLGDWMLQKYPAAHEYRTDSALYDYTTDLKKQYLGKGMTLNRVQYDNKIQVIKHALGQHHFISRAHGGKLKAVNEIRIASVFRVAPEAFLKMIVVHELAHFREKEHNKAFYKLCCHMEPQYHQLEFDLRLYLTHLDGGDPIYS